MSKNGVCRWWKVKEEGIEPGGRRRWRATVANGGVGSGGRRSERRNREMVVSVVEVVADNGVDSGRRRKQTVVFVEEEWQRRQMSLAVTDAVCILGFQNDCEFGKEKKKDTSNNTCTAHIRTHIQQRVDGSACPTPS